MLGVPLADATRAWLGFFLAWRARESGSAGAATGSSKPARCALDGCTSCAMGAGESGGPRPARFCAFAFFLGRPTGRLLRRPPEASARVAAAAAAFDALLAAASGLGGRPRFLAAATAEGSAGDAIGCLRGLPRFFGSGAGSAGGTGGLLTGLLATAETGASDFRGRPRFRAGGECTTSAVGVSTDIATLILFLLPGGRPRGRFGVFSPAVWAVSSPGTGIVREGLG